MNIRQATNAMVGKPARRMRRTTWLGTSFVSVDITEDPSGALVWDDHERDEVMLTADDILADDWEVVELRSV